MIDPSARRKQPKQPKQPKRPARQKGCPSVHADQPPFTGTAQENRRRIRGCLLAGAVGDALGAPVEFSSLADIRGLHGGAGVVDLGWYADRRGAITDDTQMTLFTVEGLMRAHDLGAVPTSVYEAHRRWLITQMTDRPPARTPATVHAIKGAPGTAGGNLGSVPVRSMAAASSASSRWRWRRSVSRSAAGIGSGMTSIWARRSADISRPAT